ncbi:DNA/RNA non-specific endonuclease [Lentzea xinjiangensis]|uniref:DNA/RNA non-specific endonuclease n=1 Tax=Lentzea xinjiangensis TaxID=402600 RepID=A0A1H9V130_9PSEU|nr:DNA/RNA non-specific endonuclease [Lentzea xinjiangensis]
MVSARNTKRPTLAFSMFGLGTSKKIARCHLIGHKLNGSNTDLANFVPCYRDPMNNPWMYHNVEAEIQKQVESNTPVLMEVKPVHSQGNPLPASIFVNAVGENGWTCSVVILN